MTAAAERRPAATTRLARTARGRGVAVVWRLELAKLARLVRVQVVALACLAGPLLAAAAVTASGAVPADTLFGQWLHESGFALPLVVLSFAGQWLLPLLASVVAGDIFAAEDHLGTWKTILTRSRSRGQLFAGKVAAAVTYGAGVLVLLAGSALLGGVLLGTEPLVGLSGQLVPAGHATTLVAASWASALPPLLGFTALAVLLSVLSRSSVVGIGGPVILGLLMQLTTLVNLPLAVRIPLLSTPFDSWHGFWAQTPFLGPFWHGAATSAGWFVVCLALSWLVFRNRSVRVS